MGQSTEEKSVCKQTASWSAKIDKSRNGYTLSVPCPITERPTNRIGADAGATYKQIDR